MGKKNNNKHEKTWWFPCQICRFPVIILFTTTFLLSQSPPVRRGTRLGFGPLSLRCRGWMTRHDTTGSGAQHQWSLRRMIGLREVASGDDLETWICFFHVGFSWWITMLKNKEDDSLGWGGAPSMLANGLGMDGLGIGALDSDWIPLWKGLF